MPQAGPLFWVYGLLLLWILILVFVASFDSSSRFLDSQGKLDMTEQKSTETNQKWNW